MTRNDSLDLLKPGQTLVFEGDSLTSRARGSNRDSWAYLRMLNWQRTYPEQVEEWLFANLPEFNLKVHHAAAGGSTIAAMERRYETMVSPHQPDVLIFTAGNNDFRKFSESEFEDRLSAYLDQMQSEHQTQLLYLGGVEPCANADESVPRRCDNARPYNIIAGKLVTDRDGVYLNIGDVLTRKAAALYEQADIHTIYAEGRHFNAVGSSIVASLVIEGLGGYDAYQSTLQIKPNNNNFK